MPGRVLFKEDFFERVVDVQWGGGLIQLSMNDYDDIFPQINLSDGLSDKLSTQGLSGSSGPIKRADLNKKWLTEIDLGDLDAYKVNTGSGGTTNFVDGTFYYEELIDLAYHPISKASSSRKKIYPEVFIAGIPDENEQMWEGAQLQARLQIFPIGTSWTQSGTTMVADRKSTYDKTKVRPMHELKGPERHWKFDQKGWLDDNDLGTYQPHPAHPPDEGGGEDTSINSYLNGLGTVGGTINSTTWTPLVFESEVTAIDIKAPHTHPLMGVISTNSASDVYAAAVVYDGTGIIDDIADVAIVTYVYVSGSPVVDQVLAVGEATPGKTGALLYGYDGTVGVAVRLKSGRTDSVGGGGLISATFWPSA